MDPRLDPLSPDNVLIIGMGPFLGTGLGLGSKTKFTFKISESYNRIGSNAWRNFRSGIIPEEALERLRAEWFQNHLKVHGISCSPGCATACSAWYQVKGDETPGAARYAGEGSGKPEYLTVASFGMMCDIRDMAAVGHLHRMCSEYSMDLQEVGNICALLMELRERGVISESEVTEWWGEPLALDWGNAETVERILVAMGTQSNKLAQIFRRGSYRGALYLQEITGKPVLQYASYGKGGSCVNEEPRPFPIWLTNMAVASRGADHLKGFSNPDKFGGTKLSLAWWGRPEAGQRFTPTLKGAHSAKSENFSAAANCLGICIIASGLGLTNIPFQTFAEAYTALTGRKLSGEDLWLIGERVCNLEKAFNSRLGLTRKDDWVCQRWLKEEVTEGPGAGMKASDYLEKTLNEYYETKGWDQVSGLQRRSTLEKLGLEEVAQVLSQEGVLAPELPSEAPGSAKRH